MFTHLQRVSEGQTGASKENGAVIEPQVPPIIRIKQEEEFMTSKQGQLDAQTSPDAGRQRGTAAPTGTWNTTPPLELL